MVLNEKEDLALRQTLSAIDRFVGEHGYPPTYRDLGIELGITHSAVFYRVRDLVCLGLVNDQPGIARSLRVTAAGRTAIDAGSIPR